MAIPSLFPNMAPQVNESVEQLLTKIAAYLWGSTGNVSGNTTGSVSTLSASAPATNQTIKASPGTLERVGAFNNSGGKVYLMVFDATTLPLNGATPTLAPQAIAADTYAFINFNAPGRVFTTGIVVAFSSTATTLTATTGGMFDATFR